MNEKTHSSPILTVAGFMSGTSLDGVDVGLLKTDGNTIFEVGPSLTLPYPKDFQEQLQHILGIKTLTPEVINVTQTLMTYHIQALQSLIEESRYDTPDLLSVHGQTLFHQKRQWNPHQWYYEKGFTWQVCIPEQLIQAFNRPVVFDHRTNDIEQGGEGAPLVPIFHFALARSFADHFSLPIAFLNIGGVSNITLIPTHQEKEMWAGDVGPGNALINDYVEKHFSLPYDAGGSLAAQGTIHKNLVQEWMKDPYFSEPFPKSLDRNMFAYVTHNLVSLSPLDSVATLTDFTVQSTLHALPKNLSVVLVCGGGRHNQTLMTSLQTALSFPVFPCDDFPLTWPCGKRDAINGDSLEAYAFAYLGARTYYGLSTSFPNTTGVPFPVVGGKIVYP